MSIYKESKATIDGDTAHIEPLDGRTPCDMPADTPVSMNMFGFTKDIIDYIEEHFEEYLKNHASSLDKCEYLIPDVVARRVMEGSIKVELLSTTAKWQGITYKEDKQKLVDEINELISEGEYKKDLWS